MSNRHSKLRGSPKAALAALSVLSQAGVKKKAGLSQGSPLSAPLKPEAVADAAACAEADPRQREKLLAKAAKRQAEDLLWHAYAQNPGRESRDSLWVHYQPLVRYISERLKTKLPECIDVNDLMGAGNIGLQDAITKFEPDMGVRFETYCVPRIRGPILDSIRALDWVPRLIRNKGHQYERTVRELAGELHREPREDEVAERLKLSMPEFAELRKELNVRAQISVESCAKDNADERDMMRLEMMESRREYEPTRDLQRDEIRNIAIRGLSDNERNVLVWYYFENVSMKDIGKRLKLSESRICQIHSQVLDVLRKKFRAYEHSCHLG